MTQPDSPGDRTGRLRTSAGALEYQWHGPDAASAPTLVFLHEGLGSLGMWRQVPAELSAQTGCGALVYSRAGYGRSDPAPLPRPVRFMHDEARILDEVLRAAGVQRAILVGHSDGASISLIHAGGHEERRGRPNLIGRMGRPNLIGRRGRPSQVSGEWRPVTTLGLILEAPHVFTEEHGLASIARVREDYQRSDLRRRLEKRHGANVDIAFNGWNEVWLHPEFRAWNIEEYLPRIEVPVLIVQGDRDEYGTWAQVEAIQRQIPGGAEVVRVPDCGHAPHKERPDVVLPAMVRFIEMCIW